MFEAFPSNPDNLVANEAILFSDLKKMETKTINLDSEKQDLELLELSIKKDMQSDISWEKNVTSTEKQLSENILKYLDNNYKRIIPSPDWIEPIEVINSLSLQEKNIYTNYLDDYKYLKQYVLDPNFKIKIKKASWLSDSQVENVMNKIYEFFKYDIPQNELIIDYNPDSKVNWRAISFFWNQVKDNKIILYKEAKERHFWAHEISHLIFDEISKFYMVQPTFELLDKSSLYSEDAKKYSKLSQEQYPNIFQIRAEYNIMPEQKITIQEAKKIINEHRNNIFISNLSPKVLKEIMNSWWFIYKAIENHMRNLNHQKDPSKENNNK